MTIRVQGFDAGHEAYRTSKEKLGLSPEKEKKLQAQVGETFGKVADFGKEVIQVSLLLAVVDKPLGSKGVVMKWDDTKKEPTGYDVPFYGQEFKKDGETGLEYDRTDQFQRTEFENAAEELPAILKKLNKLIKDGDIKAFKDQIELLQNERQTNNPVIRQFFKDMGLVGANLDDVGDKHGIMSQWEMKYPILGKELEDYIKHKDLFEYPRDEDKNKLFDLIAPDPTAPEKGEEDSKGAPAKKES